MERLDDEKGQVTSLTGKGGVDWWRISAGSSFFWEVLPSALRERLTDALDRAVLMIEQILRYDAEKKMAQNFVVAAYSTNLIASRLKYVVHYAHEKVKEKRRASPIAIMRDVGYWMDELALPEEATWLAMTVPRRVWYWLVVDPVKRKKFFDFIKENFPEGIPAEPMTEG